MSLFQVTTHKLEPVPSTTFSVEGMMERRDLQRLLRADISALGNDLFVIAEEFGDWEDSKRRIDLLCIDKQSRIVVVEIKRSEDGGHMELQAIRYAAMVSSMTVDQAIHAYARLLGGDEHAESAKNSIISFLGVESIDEVEFDGDVRVILVAADFSTEITTAVMWLNKYDLDITCVRMRPYSIGGQILVDLTQIIPLPEAAEYEVKIRAQAREAKQVKSAREEILKRFWAQLIDRSKGLTPLISGRRATTDAWISMGFGKGFTLQISLSKDRARTECYIKFGQDNLRSKATFDALMLKRQHIESDFGAQLDWQDLPGKMGCRICKDVVGGWQIDDDAWPKLQQTMIENLIALERALRGPIQALSV